MSIPVPLEDEEQHAFTNWLDMVGLRYTAVANSTYTTSWRQKSRNHYLGLRAGFPDLIVLVPSNRSRDGNGYFLAVEMKRRKLGTVSQVQKDWLKALNNLGTDSVKAVVCKGSEEAMDFVLQYLKPRPGDDSPF